MTAHSLTVRERFELKYEVDDDTGCWLWNAGKSTSGYGSFRMGQMRRAHRISYELYVGKIPEGLLVLHACDVKHCVSPNHLFLGTQADNIADRDEKGRGRWGRGETSSYVKLTERQVRQIRNFRGRITQQAVAEKFGITQSNVSIIQSGKTWTHIEA